MPVTDYGHLIVPVGGGGESGKWERWEGGKVGRM